MTDQELADMTQDVCDRLNRSHFRIRNLDRSEMVGRVYVRLHQIRRKLDKHPHPIKAAMVAARYEFLKGLENTREDERRWRRERVYAQNRGNMWSAADPHDDIAAVDNRDELERLSRGCPADMVDVMVGKHVLGFSGADISRAGHRKLSWASGTEYEAKKRMRFNLSCSDMFPEYLAIYPDLREQWRARSKAITSKPKVDEQTYDDALSRAMQRWNSRGRK